MWYSVDETVMKLRYLNSPKVFPKKVVTSGNSLSPRGSQSSSNGHFVLGLLCSIWSSINKFVAAVDVPKSQSCFERAYQDWILPQIQIKNVSFILLSILCVFEGLTVVSQEDYQYLNVTAEWSFKLSLAIMPYVFCCGAFILVTMYFFPQLMEKNQYYVITYVCVTAMVFIPAGNILLTVGEHGAARLDTLLLNTHLLLLTLLFYDQGFIRIMIISIITYIFVNVVNIFTTFFLQNATEHPMRQVC